MPIVTYDRLVEDVKRKGIRYIEKKNNIRIPCPAHGGKSYSLVISRRDNGGVLCKCHSQNCSFHNIVYAITGIDLSDKQSCLDTSSLPLPPPAPAFVPELTLFKANPKDILAIYPYTDAHGKVLYQKLRMRTHNSDGSRRTYKVKNQKHGDIPVSKYRFRHQINGIWYNGKGDDSPLLYLAHLLPFAETVYLCEGEKDADNLNNALKDKGIFGSSLATTSYEGATGLSSPIAKWRPQYTSQLMGKTIVIFPDMDASGQGEHHAHLVAQQLVSCCPCVSVVPFPNETKSDGYDLSDYLQSHSFDDLLSLVEKARPKTLSFINLPSGAYLSDHLTSFDQLPQFCILDAPTGIGKTTAMINLIVSHGCGILVVSSVIALRQLQKKCDENNFAFGVFYQDQKQIQPMMLTTPESLPLLVEKLNQYGLVTPGMPLIIDEWHNLAIASYRTGMNGLLEVIKHTPWLCIIGMSGTPLPLWTDATDHFQTVRVNTPLRNQVATFIHWQLHDEKGQPLDCSRTDTIVELALEHINNNQRVIIHLNDKGRGLDSLIAKFLAIGIPDSQIGTLNSDNKYETVGTHVINEEIVPDQCLILIVTSIFIESANLKTTFGAVIITSDLHPIYAQQLVNRKRGDAIPNCYILSNGTGHGWELDRDAIHLHVLKHATFLCQELNANAEHNIPLTPDDMQIFGSQWRDILFRDSQGVWRINLLAVTQAVYDIERRYCIKNPLTWKNIAREYGWSFLPDRTLGVLRSQLNSTIVQKEKEICQDRSEKKAEAWEQQCGDLATLKNVNEAKAELRNTEGMPRRATERAIELDSHLQQRETEEDSAERWLDAVALLLSQQKDSARRHNKLLRILLIDLARKKGHSLLQLIEETFLGQELTQDERYTLLLYLYQSVPQFAPFTRNVLLRHWSKDEAPLLTPKDCDELLSCIFQVKKLHNRNQSRKWRFEAIHDIDALIEKHKEHAFSLRQEKLETFNLGIPQVTETVNVELERNVTETPPNFLYTQEIEMFSGVKVELAGNLSVTPLNFDSYLEKEMFSGVFAETDEGLVGGDEAKIAQMDEIEVRKVLMTNE